ncbi:MAG: glycosyl hydrolase family 28 protein [Bacteroidota bacterium]|nr:glycosyl hydrolase family 28 protein [Bacteroidota bacterium]
MKRINLLFTLIVFANCVGAATCLVRSAASRDPLSKVRPATSPGIYKVELFGARADAITNNTIAIQAAIDECSLNGGGKVELTEGVYLSGCLILKNNVTLDISSGSALKAIADTSAYRLIQSSVISRMDVVPWRAFIRADSQHDINLCGGGTIDASGDAPCFRDGIENSPNRPYGLFFVNCKDISVENLKLRSSAFWMQRYFSCSNVRITRLDVFNHANKNNDGIDIDSSNDVIVSDCNIDSSDDAICIKSEGERSSKNIVVTNCIVATHASAIKLGTGSVGGFENICISNIVIHHSTSKVMMHPMGVWGGLSGIDIATTDGGVLRQVQILNVCMEDVQNPIHVRLGNRLSGNVARQGYGEIEDKSQGVTENGRSAKIAGDLRLEDVTISNIMAQHVGPYPVIIAGHEGHPVKRITLRDITIQCGTPGTKEDECAAINWKADIYPGRGMYNTCLPVYGLITNFTEGLVVENFHAIPAKGEVRQPEMHLNMSK